MRAIIREIGVHRSVLLLLGCLFLARDLAGPDAAHALSIDAIPAAARAKLAPELLPILAAGDEAPPVSVIVLMADQVDLERLNAQLTAEGVERRARAARVIPVLKERAERTWESLAPEIWRWQALGMSRTRSFWMVNALLVSGTPAAVIAIAEHPDVARIELDQAIGTEQVFAEPSDGLAGAGDDPLAPGQAEPGLRVVAAPALWGRGFTGAGILVMNLDSGVDGQHPSMGPRWLGNVPGVLASDAWFDHPIQQACATPCDYAAHGTLTLSVVTGLDSATADTVGVSFGSKWIAGAVVGATTGHVLAGFEWAVDPPGGTRPPADVLSLSIQDPSVGLAGDCGPNGTYWQVVDAFEAIGGAVTWAAGNEGPGAQTVNYPKNRIATPVNMFTVGNISPHSPTFPIHSTSSRGPSRCDGVTPKPECVAPGTTIRVATPGGGYGTFSGTSLAGPHAAGVCALLMEAFPAVTGSEIKLALLATARDLGVPGDDNTYGMGLIDAGLAFDLLQSTTGAGDPGSVPAPAGVTLSEATPNPFRPQTALAIGLPAAARITVRVYNLKGQVVASLAESEERAAGRHELFWDGRRGDGQRAPSGVYFFRLEARTGDSSPARTWLRKAVLLD